MNDALIKSEYKSYLVNVLFMGRRCKSFTAAFTVIEDEDAMATAKAGRRIGG